MTRHRWPIFTCLLLWNLCSIVSSEEQIDANVSSVGNSTDAKLEIVCIQDVKAYCKDKPEGLEFDDGCRECQCKSNDAFCKTARCAQAVAPTTNLEDYCNEIFAKNKKAEENWNPKKTDGILDGLPIEGVRIESPASLHKELLPGSFSGNDSRLNSSNPFEPHPIFPPDLSDHMRDPRHPMKPGFEGPYLGSLHMNPPHPMGPSPHMEPPPHSLPGPDKFPRGMEKFDDFPPHHGGMEHQMSGMKPPEMEHSKPWFMNIFDGLLGTRQNFHRQRMEFEKGLEKDQFEMKQLGSKLSTFMGNAKKNAPLSNSSVAEKQGLMQKEADVRKSDNEKLKDKLTFDKLDPKMEESDKSKSTKKKVRSLFKKLFGSKKSEDEEKSSTPKGKEDALKDDRLDKELDLKEHKGPHQLWPPRDRYPPWIFDEPPMHGPWGKPPMRTHEPYDERMYFGPERYPHAKYGHGGPEYFRSRGYGYHSSGVHYRRPVRLNEYLIMPGIYGYSRPDWREESGGYVYADRHPQGPLIEHQSNWRLTSGVNNVVEAENNHTESHEEPHADPIPHTEEGLAAAAEELKEDFVEVPAGSFLLTAQVLRAPTQESTSAKIIATSAEQDFHHQGMQFGDMANAGHSVKYLMYQLELMKKELEDYKQKLKTCQIYRSRMRNALKTQLEQHNAGSMGKSVWSLGVPLFIGAYWWH